MQKRWPLGRRIVHDHFQVFMFRHLLLSFSTCMPGGGFQVLPTCYSVNVMNIEVKFYPITLYTYCSRPLADELFSRLTRPRLLSFESRSFMAVRFTSSFLLRAPAETA